MNARVRTLVLMATGIASLGTIVIAAGQSAGAWDLSWNAITGGGGRSTGGGYELHGAIIPVDGTSSGGSYALSGGFFGGGEAVKFKKFHPGIAKDGIN